MEERDQEIYYRVKAKLGGSIPVIFSGLSLGIYYKVKRDHGNFDIAYEPMPFLFCDENGLYFFKCMNSVIVYTTKTDDWNLYCGGIAQGVVLTKFYLSDWALRLDNLLKSTDPKPVRYYPEYERKKPE